MFTRTRSSSGMTSSWKGRQGSSATRRKKKPQPPICRSFMPRSVSWHWRMIFVRSAREGRSVAGRKEMIDRTHELSVKRQAALLGISRGSVCYQPREVPETELVLMRRIDELHLDYQFAGSRMLRDLLAGEGLHVGRLHVSTLMKRMDVEALYRKPNTSKPEPGHKIYRYLLRKRAVTRPNQVWAIDITCVPMAKGVRHRSRADGDQCLTVPGRRRRLVQPETACLRLSITELVAPLVRATMASRGGLLYRGRRRSHRPIRLS